MKKMSFAVAIVMLLTCVFVLVSCDEYNAVYTRVPEEELAEVTQILLNPDILETSFTYSSEYNHNVEDFVTEKGNDRKVETVNIKLNGVVEFANDLKKHYQHWQEDKVRTSYDGGRTTTSVYDVKIWDDSIDTFVHYMRGGSDKFGNTKCYFDSKESGWGLFANGRYYPTFILQYLLEDDSCVIYRSGNKYKVTAYAYDAVYGIGKLDATAYVITNDDGVVQSIKCVQSYDSSMEIDDRTYVGKLSFECVMNFGEYSVEMPENSDEFVPGTF